MKLFNFFKRKAQKNDAAPASHNEPTASIKVDKIHYTPAMPLSTVLDFIKNNAAQLGIYLTPGAGETDIALFEAAVTTLPDDFKLLYKMSNGFETDEDLFRLIPLNEIADAKRDGDLISATSFHFTEYMIYCDMWTVDVNTATANSYRIYNKPDDVVFLTNSLGEFLATFINKGIYEGLYQWGEDIKKQLPKP